MSEERTNENVWNAERILYGYIYNSDEEGCLPNIKNFEDSSYKIGLQRYYAALRAYDKQPEWFYRPNENRMCGSIRDVWHQLLSKTRSKEKMEEFRDLVKKHLRHGQIYEHMTKIVDDPGFLKNEMEVEIAFDKLMECRMKLYAVQDIWGGMLECSRSVGLIYYVTTDMTREYVWPMINIIDRMIVLLMGDDYDKSFTVDELLQFGYPDITDEDLYKMSMEDF